jgi:hypothetical protein
MLITGNLLPWTSAGRPGHRLYRRHDPGACARHFPPHRPYPRSLHLRILVYSQHCLTAAVHRLVRRRAIDADRLRLGALSLAKYFAPLIVIEVRAVLLNRAVNCAEHLLVPWKQRAF